MRDRPYTLSGKSLATIMAGLHSAGTRRPVVGLAANANAEHEQFKATVIVAGADIYAALAEVERIAVSGPSIAYARRVVLGRIDRSEAIRQDIASEATARVVAREHVQGGRMMLELMGYMHPVDIAELDREPE